MSLVIHGIGTDSSQPEDLAVGNASHAMERVAALVVEVLMVVYWLGVDFRNQAVSIYRMFALS